MDKIERIIINTIQNEMYMFEMQYHKKPSYVVLAPWMVSIFKESLNQSRYARIQGEDTDALCGLMVIESPKIEDLSEIEVY